MTKTFIIQHLPSSGDFDYSEYASIEAAWEAEKGESWVQTAMEEGDKTLEECRKEFLDTLTEYTEEEVLKAHEDGYTWPVALGLIDFHGEDDFSGDKYAFNLRGVELEEIEDTPAIRATIVTAHGELEVVEWLNADGKAERTDSNIKINTISDLKKLFPKTDSAPVVAVFDALDAVAPTAIADIEDAKRVFPNVLDDGWMWPEGSQLEKDIIIWANSPCKRLLTVEVEHEGLAHHFVFVDEVVIEQWGDLSAEQIPAAESRAREFVEDYRA